MRRFGPAVVVALMLAGCGGAAPSPTDSGSPSSTNSNGVPTNSGSASPAPTYSPPPVETKDWVTTIDRRVTKSKYWEEFTYPEFSASKSGNAILDSIVTSLNEEVATMVAAFKKRAKYDYSHPEGDLPWSPSTFYLTGLQEIGSKNLLFIRMEHNEMAYFEAHGGGATWTEVYDLRTGKRLKLIDQLLADQKDPFVTLVIDSLVTQVGQDALDDPQTMWNQLRSYEDFICWSVADGGLSITFNEYVVGPYASGTPAISIPWQQLVTIVDRKSVLGVEFAPQLNFVEKTT